MRVRALLEIRARLPDRRRRVAIVEEKRAQRAARARERGDQSDTAVIDNCA